ncbi:MAG: polyprenyl diphosphate synthase [bacterium]|jgi:undecaprenyl diphosphate synthase
MFFLKKLIYYFYEKKLNKEVSNKKAPSHVGIILDGNRRYAERKGFVNVSQGHRQGADKIDEVILWCLELKIKIVTIWGFSTDNFNRREGEVNSLFNIIKSKLELYIDSDFIDKNKIKVSIIGKKDLLPDDLKDVIKRLEEKTNSHSNLYLYIALGYGGRQEICDALGKFIADNFYDISSAVKEDENYKNEIYPQTLSCDRLSNLITVDNISKYLYATDVPDPELIIRTSGEVRLSGFLLWQSAYSEYYFCDVYWPEFRKIDFLRAIRSYQFRQIRQGK